MLAKPVGETGNGGGGVTEDRILIRDEKSAGTNGGTFTSGSWQTRDLNTEVEDDGGHASLSGNQITLAAGTYMVKASSVATSVQQHKLRLRNITDSSDLIIGLSHHITSTAVTSSAALLRGKFTIAAPKIIELQHRCTLTRTNNGFGVASNYGVIEIYSSIELLKRA